MTSAVPSRIVLGTLAVGLTLAACGDERVDTAPVQRVAAAARADIDALAAQIGTDPQVRQDTVDDCTPGDRSSGKILTYSVRVTVDDSAVERLRGEIADGLAADGWTVKRDPSRNPTTGESVRFQKGATTMGASIFVEKGYASVGGSGGCVR